MSSGLSAQTRGPETAPPAVGGTSVKRRIAPVWVLEVAIVIAWMVMVGYAWDRAQTPLSAGSDGMALLNAAAEGPGAEWVGIYLQDQKIGAGLADSLKSKDGYRIQERTWLKLRAFEQDRELTTVFTANTDLEQRLKDFRFVLNAPPSQLDVSGQMYGNRLVLMIRTGGEVQQKTLDLKEVPEIALTYKEKIAAQKPSVGQVIEVPYFDPASLSEQKMQVTVLGEGQAQVGNDTIPTLILETSFHGVKSKAVITRDGRTLEETNALGMKLKRETRDQAMSGGWKEDSDVDIIALSAVPIDEPIQNARQTVQLEAHLSGGGVEVLLPRGETGSRAGDIHVRIPARETWKTYQIPMLDARYASYLADSTLLQTKNPKISQVAQSIIGDITNAEDAAARLSAWVFERLKKEPVMGVPNAIEILQMGRGDCNEHTVLFTALARAVGIPTRMAAGIVYSEQVTGNPAFYYHAWPEIFLGEWVPIDPTFGQFPADATHVKLVEGELDQQLSLLRVVGNLKVDVRSYQ